jgi:hypothetical protein
MTSRCLKTLTATFFALLLVFPATAVAEEKSQSKFKDPETGEFDLSTWLAGRAGFFPVPMIITEPAVGYGGGLFLTFFHPKKGRAVEWNEAPDGAVEKMPDHEPPSVSGIGGFATENGTWGTGLFHFGVWREDTYRYTGALMRNKVNLTFYGFGDDDSGFDYGVDYTMDGWFFLQKLTRRVKDTNFYIGGKYGYVYLDNSFSTEIEIPGLTDETFLFRTGGLGVVAEYDGRDNIFTPNRGIKSVGEIEFYEKIFGSDYDFTKYKLYGYGYVPLHKRVVLGIRLDTKFTGGDVPFFQLPYISLRGIPAMRYQGKHTIVGEVEARWNAYKRWSLVGFFGGGRAVMSLDDLDDTDPKYAGGAGFRYLIARLFGMQAGIDVARGPDEWAFYVVSGSYWR